MASLSSAQEAEARSNVLRRVWNPQQGTRPRHLCADVRRSMPDQCLHPQMNSSTSSRAHETSIQNLASKTGASLEETRVLFNAEFARLARDARVRTYLHVLATSNVRAILCQK